MARRHQTSVGWSELAIYSNFGQHIFGTVTVEASIIKQHHEVPYRLSSDWKCLTLRCHFYVKICFHRRFDYFSASLSEITMLK